MFGFRIKPRRRAHKRGPIRFNRSGLRLSSITMHLGPFNTLVLWERKER